VLERHRVGNSWRSERWDSLRLLTPNWLTRLPGFGYDGDDHDGYMTAAEVVQHLHAYRVRLDAPVVEHVAVSSIGVVGDGFVVATSEGPWHCRAVVIATGAASIAKRPPVSTAFPDRIDHIDPTAYRNPEQIRGGRVLVVGSSASGVQIADELIRSGRDVTLSVGDHVRVPRRYRGMDIHWWMHTLGVLDERWTDVADLGRARRMPSLQLVGSPEARDLDLNTLSRDGAEIVGRVTGVRGQSALCSGGLHHLCQSADLKQRRLLDRIDAFATEHGLDSELTDPTRPEPTRIVDPPTEIDLDSIGTVVWATGFRVDHRWIDVGSGAPTATLAHDGGIGRVPGTYVLGLPFQRRRSSTFLSGVGDDAIEIALDVAAHLDRTAVTRR
jgi:putative flavoprotein involved in K+ transport